ncbi:MAG: NAD(P)/FAD-dependent oxidoreductase, partial [Gammaproteobacteria bacterium]|nr:NAD(P)/FAD-dependent oxidoreductase [Gammaproteobacteria bacterium]
MFHTDVLIIGASAAGLMCAIEAGKRGRRVTVLDHASKAGKKILMSGGGRCNFTNTDISASNYISHNPHFCKSALSRYTQWDFIALVEAYRIPYHERDLGKLFCDISAKDILNMLLAECEKVNVDIRLDCSIETIDTTNDSRFRLKTSHGAMQAPSLVVASGGLSIPKMCASPLGYRIAEQFGHHIWPTAAGLVPFTLQPQDKAKLAELPGIAIHSTVSNPRSEFSENILFTHRGLSGPAILQISSYWQPGEPIDINLLPDVDINEILKARQATRPKLQLKTLLSEILPRRLVLALLDEDSANT